MCLPCLASFQLKFQASSHICEFHIKIQCKCMVRIPWSMYYGSHAPLQILQLLQVDVFFGSDAAPSIWPWSHLEDFVRLALACKTFALDGIVARQLANIAWCVWWHDEEAFWNHFEPTPGTPESSIGDLHEPLVDLEEEPDGLGFPYQWSPSSLESTSPPM